MAVSQMDVAKRASVSQPVVSRVLNGQPLNVRVSKATQKRVLQACKALDYRPNRIARALRTRTSTTVGLILHGVPTTDAHGLLYTIIREIKARDYEVLPAMTRWKESEESEEIRRLLDRGVDGLILISPGIDAIQHAGINELVERDFPLVCIGPVPSDRVNAVDWDRRGAFAALTEHLLEQGCRRFVFLGHRSTPGTRQRIEGVAASLAAAGCDPPAVVYSSAEGVSTAEEEAAVRAAFERYAKRDWPDAILAVGDDLAMVAMRVARDLGRAVPARLAVTGGGNASFSPYLEVPLTTLETPLDEMARAAVARLFRLLDRGDDDPRPLPLLQTFPAKLILRASGRFGQG